MSNCGHTVRNENWNGHTIRFTDAPHDGGWWAVASDVANALKINNTPSLIYVIEKGIAPFHETCPYVKTKCLSEEVIAISEVCLYELLLISSNPEASKFRHWLASKLLSPLRQSIGCSPWEPLRFTDLISTCRLDREYIPVLHNN